MALFFRIRDWFKPPAKKLAGLPIPPGAVVLDYGCGPGSYAVAAARLVGDEGKVHAADIHPLAIKSVTKRARKAGLQNLETIQTDCVTGLPAGSVDVILVLDVFHDLPTPAPQLAEFARVIKPGGTLVLNDHHLSDEEAVTALTTGSHFSLAAREASGFFLFRPA